MRFEFVENQNYVIDNEQLNEIKDILYISDEIKRGLGMRFSPIEVSGTTIRCNGIAANIRYGDTELIVKPKVQNQVEESSNNNMKSLYLRVLKTCKSNLNSVVYFTSMTTENKDDNSFIDCIAQYYFEKLTVAVKKLPIIIYYEKEEKRSSIKGKVLIQKELKTPIRDGKIWCKYISMTTDNNYNALLKWCCIFLSQSIQSKSLKRKYEMLISELGGDWNELNSSLVKQMRLPRNFDAYKESFSIAKDIYLYNQQKLKLRTDRKHICGYVINMEKAFENIVSYYVDKISVKKQVLHLAQADTRFAIIDNEHENLEFHVRPDDLLIRGKEKLVIDAKYKNIDYEGKPLREDFYQMISSCIAYQTYEAMLIYPTTDGMKDYDKKWKVLQKVNGNELKVSANKINIMSSDNEIINQLTAFIDKTKFMEEISG